MEAELPKFKKEEISLAIENNCLILMGTKEDDKEATFKKPFPIPEETDRGNIEATFEDGILTVKMVTGGNCTGDVSIPVN